MTGPEGSGDIRIVLGMLVHVGNKKSYGSSGGFTLKHSGNDFDGIRLIPHGGEFPGSGTSSVKIRLNILLRQFHPRRAAVHNCHETVAMAFTAGSNPKKLSKGISGHYFVSSF